MRGREDWLGRYEAVRGPLWRLFAAGAVLWTFLVQIHGLPVWRMVLTGVVPAALLAPLYRYPARRRGARRGWLPPFLSLCAAAIGVYYNWVMLPHRDPWLRMFLVAGLSGGIDFPAPSALASVLLVIGLAALVGLQSGRLLSDPGLRFLSLAGIFAAFTLGRLRRESRLREQHYLRELDAAPGRLEARKQPAGCLSGRGPSRPACGTFSASWEWKIVARW